MGIFAGAPKPAERDSWIVIPRPPSSATTAERKVNRTTSMATGLGTSTIGRSTLRPSAGAGKRLSRIVDAVIDSPQVPREDAGHASDDSGGPPPALERALRRGLSDSSIRTTFTQHGGEEAHDAEAESSEGAAQPSNTQSVLQALSRKVQAFRFVTAAASTQTSGEESAPPTSAKSSQSRPQTPVARASTVDDPTTPRRSPPRAIPPRKGTGGGGARGAEGGAPASTSLFGLSSWTAGYDEMEDAERPVGGPYYAGSPREEGFGQRNWTRDREF